MYNLDLTEKSLLVQSTDIKQNTQRILEFCKRLKEGDSVLVEVISGEEIRFQFPNLPEFLELVNSKVKIDLDLIYSCFQSDFGIIGLKRARHDDSKVISFIKRTILKFKRLLESPK